MKTKMIKHSLRRFENERLLSSALHETKTYYRPLDPGSYLYNKICNYDIDSKFNTDFIELLYVTLAAWNMNSRGAKLQEYCKFEKSIMDNKKRIYNIVDLNIKDISEEPNMNQIEELFYSLDLVASTKPALVTFTKTMHFLLPELVVPIDRTYTLMYFYENVNIPKEKEKQFAMIKEIQCEFSRFANTVSMDQYIDNKWNRTAAKVMDNMIIGYRRMNK
jgi:hypothetical protein